MKVLFINTIYGKGSTGRIVFDLGTMLEEKGHTFVAAYGRGKAPDDPHGYRIGSFVDTCEHAVMTRFTDNCGFYSRNATKKLIEFIRQEHPDIIHLHNLHGYYVNIELLFEFIKQEYRGSVVWTLHDCWSFTGHCTHFDFIGCDRWKKECHDCPQTKRYPSSLFLDHSRENYAKKKDLFTGLKHLSIVTPSAWLKEKVQQSFLKEYPVTVIPNGIDLNTFSYQPVVNRTNQKIILNVTDGLDERKGFYDLLKLREYLNDDYVIRVVGVSPSKEFLKEGMEFIPHTSDVNQLVHYYREAEVLVNPTYEDTFPTINLEAAACGLPVITYDSGGCPETVDEYTGIVIKRGDIKELADAVKTVNLDRNVIAEHSKRFDKNKTYLEYLKLFEDLAYNK